MKSKELRELIELLYEKGFSEFEIERKGFRMRLTRGGEQEPHTLAPSQPIIVASPIPVPMALSGSTVLAEPPKQRSAEASVESIKAATPQSDQEELHIIKSPIVGTFYRAASPDAEPFVRIGDRIEHETVVCIIEAMKLMNEIQAEVSGEVVRCFVENKQSVEYGQKLFEVRT